MPPQIALYGSFALIFWLFRHDRRERPVGSKALWAPALLLLVISTRPVAYWFASSSTTVLSNIEGNPIDSIILLVLIIAAWRILLQRRINWGRFVVENLSILTIYFFFLLSVLWADYPFAVFKRVLKDSSLILFAMVLMTERDPSYAIRKIVLRCSYIVLTLSVITVKYFPGVGTRVTKSGDNQFIGLTTQKNMLGETAFTFLIILIWDLAKLLSEEHPRWRDPRVLVRCLMIYFGMWLLIVSESKTSLLCLIIGLLVMLGARQLMRHPNPKPKLIALFFGVIVLFGLDSTFHITEAVVHAVGKNMTFTGRTNIWTEVLSQPVNPVVGTGFMMFWDSPLGMKSWADIEAKISTAHNGYLEVFLDGGFIGVTLLAFMLLGRGNVIINRMIAGHFWGRLGLAFWILALFHNLSESTYFRFTQLWFFFILSMITVPRPPFPPAPELKNPGLQPLW